MSNPNAQADGRLGGRGERRYSDEYLLEYLNAHGCIEGTATTRSVRECELCPDPATYRKRFGSWRRACELAGVECGNQFGRTT